MWYLVAQLLQQMAGRRLVAALQMQLCQRQLGFLQVSLHILLAKQLPGSVKVLPCQFRLLLQHSKPVMAQVQPTVQTEAASQRGDVIDDPAVWHHPSAPARSLILATDKRAGLDVYNMQGKRVQQLSVGRLNNVDVRYGLNWQGSAHDIAVASLRDDNSLQLFAIDNTGKLHNAGKVATAMTDIYGLCMYHSAQNNKHYVFVNDKSGLIQQYRIDTNGNAWQGSLVRSLQVPSQPEGCVADDNSGLLFVGEEDAGIWRFAAEPDAAVAGEQIILADGETLVLDYTIRVQDTTGGQDTQTVRITITGDNDAPVLTAQTQAVTEDGSQLTGNMAATDMDAGDTKTFSTSTAAAFAVSRRPL